MITVIESHVLGSKMVGGTQMNRVILTLVGLSDEKPVGIYKDILIGNGSVYREIDTGVDYQYDEAGQTWNVYSERGGGTAGLTAAGSGRVSSLDGTELVSGPIVEVLGIPQYIDNPTDYPAFGLTESGWYILARIAAKTGQTVTNKTMVNGAAGYIAQVGAEYVDVAVRFDTAAISQTVIVDWGTSAELVVFRATDLFARNMDYRVSYYVYDIKDFATWFFTRATDATYAGTEYWKEEDGVYSRAAVKALEPIPDGETYYTHSYAVTTDTEFVEGVTYYTKDDTVYTEAEVIPGNPVVPEGAENPTPIYYVDVWTPTDHEYFNGTAYYVARDGEYEQIPVKAGEPCSYYTKVVTYPLPEHTAFVGTEYWVQDESDLGYARTAVKAGDEMDADTYYTHAYVLLTAAGKFQADTRYYKLVSGVYELQTVTVGGSYSKNVYYIDKWTLAEGKFIGTAYYLETNGAFEQVPVMAGETIPEAYYTQCISYELTEDEKFVTGKNYYTVSGGIYAEAEVEAGATVEPYSYYEMHVSYSKEAGTFNEGVTYYTARAGVFTMAEVTPGEAIPDVEYHVQLVSWPQATEPIYADGETYYTCIGGAYEEAEVYAGDPVPAYYVHSKVTFEGMPRNVTYKFDDMIDAPVEIVLPDIPDDGYGAWYEIQLRHKSEYSTTLIPPSGGVKIASDSTPAQSKGINILDLHYNAVGGAKVWRLVNTHSNFAGS